ncbi:TRAP transporter small permease [Curvibacter sp. CHRR-16]|uniref:TRAP transporter small permease n=1 Tax=Curvibacter sp. CHRR-16 TaxID=2835872 RepID=UPI001BDA7EE0|nr:TRAP transporter small permease [Curvibacter sp. CHRR-16]MBT0570124.1 TRAP transporter small permease [Curvibacter sp. CHRR-16]
MFTKFCKALAKLSLVLGIIGLIAVIIAVQWAVFGRYVLNDTPTWAEDMALLLVLFVTSFGVAVGVRDAGHIGLESLVALLPEKGQRIMELVIHGCVVVFGVVMTYSSWQWASLKWNEKKPMLPLPDGIDYVPLIIAGALIVLFSIEHIVAILRGQEVEESWN